MTTTKVAIIDSNTLKIANIIVGDLQWSKTAFPQNIVVDVTTTDVSIGDTYHQQSNSFVKEAASQTPQSINWKITRLAFRQRFLPQEKTLLYTEAQTNLGMAVYIDDINSATFIDLTRHDTVLAVRGLELAGIIAEGRADQILLTPPTQDEVYKG